MRRNNKPGLADLKQLRSQTQSPDLKPAQAPSGRRARKRAPFLPPSASPPALRAASKAAAADDAARAPGQPASQSQQQQPPQQPQGAQLSEADRRLFRHAMRHVHKLPDPGRVLLAPVAPAHASILRERRMRAAGLEAVQSGKLSGSATEAPLHPPAVSVSALSDTYAPVTGNSGDDRYLKPGHGTDVLRGLKRGKWPIGASLDLHGSTLDDARDRFERFLVSCLNHDVKCVRIVHGKGYGSRDGDAVLKTAVRRWLTQIAEVIAYTECAEADGGSGAVQVLLK